MGNFTNNHSEMSDDARRVRLRNSACPSPERQEYRNLRKTDEYKLMVKQNKGIFSMGGFMEEEAMKQLRNYFSPVVLKYMKSKADIDSGFIYKLENVSEIYESACCYFDKYIDRINRESFRENADIDVAKPDFLVWYTGQTIDFLYGKDSHMYGEYFYTRKEFDIDECLGSTERNIVYNLNPVEFMFYMASAGLDDNLSEDQDERARQLDVKKNYVRIVDEYVADTVRAELWKANGGEELW